MNITKNHNYKTKSEITVMSLITTESLTSLCYDQRHAVITTVCLIKNSDLLLVIN